MCYISDFTGHGEVHHVTGKAIKVSIESHLLKVEEQH